jgi:hypothetical protein
MHFVEVDGQVQPSPAPKFSRTSTSAGCVPGKGEHTQELLRELSKQ